MGKYNTDGYSDGDDAHTITLTHDQVLVLSGFLDDVLRSKELRFPHPAEYLALSHLVGQLERIPWESFDPEYTRLLEEARLRLSKGFEGTVAGLGEVAVDEHGNVVRLGMGRD